MKVKIPLQEADAVAFELLQWIRPVCQRVELVGSVRRRQKEVGDIEILVIPQLETVSGGLFGSEETSNLLDRTLRELIDKKAIKALKGFKTGWKFCQLEYRALPFDLFCADAQTWGCLCVIRTGPAEFSHKLVTHRRLNGLCPAHLRFKDGRLWAQKEPLETPTEESVFKALGVDYIPPEERK